jgi:hypothetical protein
MIKGVIVGDPTPVVFPDGCGTFRARLAVAVCLKGDLSVPQCMDIYVPALLPINFYPSKETEVDMELIEQSQVFDYRIVG